MECWLEIFNPSKNKNDKPGAAPKNRAIEEVPRIWDVSGEPK
jgi:hypothetical protein